MVVNNKNIALTGLIAVGCLFRVRIPIKMNTNSERT